jgi:hypothetical protein
VLCTHTVLTIKGTPATSVRIEVRPTINGVKVELRDGSNSLFLGEFWADKVYGQMLPTAQKIVEAAKLMKLDHLVTEEAIDTCLTELQR